MLSQTPRRDRSTPIYPASTNSVVSELSHQNRSDAEAQIWRDLQTKDGAVWHRQFDKGLADLSARLREIAPKLAEWQRGYAHVSAPEALEEALARSVDASQLVTHELITSEQAHCLKEQYRAMYQLLCAMTGSPRVVLDLRIERSGAYIETYHQDYGTALLMSLVGPGTHFIHPDNQPASHEGTFLRKDLRRSDQIFEVPTCSLLAMRGKFDSDEALHRPPQGLWHSSPSKTWNGVTQWDTRVLLIATSSESQILTPSRPRA